MRRYIRVLFLIAFAAMLLLPLALTDTQEGAVSDADGRALAAAPAAFDASFPAAAELWLKDRLGFRDEIYAADETIHDRVFSELINPTYQYGRNGYTFFKMHSNIEYDGYHRSFVNMIADIQKYCESRGTRFYYIFNPEKESVYRKQLPAGVNYSDEWADAMLKDMEDRGVNCIDLRETLADRDDGDPAFDRINDAGHWNQRGAFLGMQELTKAMHEDDPEILGLRKDEYDISSTAVQSMYSSMLEINEDVPSYDPRFGITDITGDMATELSRSPSYPSFQLMKNESEEAAGIERLLLLNDDVYWPFAFARAKETAAITCLGNTTDFEYYYNVFKPDVVVLETMEYVINDAYFSQARMDEEDRNPSIIKLFPESSFTDRKNALIENTPEGRDDISAVLIPGKSIDRLFISYVPKKAKYAYLLTDDSVTDLIRNDHGAYLADVRHGEIKDGDKLHLYITDKKGRRVCSSITVTEKRKSIEKLADSKARIKVSGLGNRLELSETGGHNRLSYSVLRLYNEDFSKYITELTSSGVEGRTDAAYCHREESGNYKLEFIIGGNLGAEMIQYDVRLTEGETYWISYDTEKLSEDRIIISGFSFSKAAER